MTVPTRVRCLDPPGPPSMAPGAPAYVSYPSFNAGAAPSYPPYGAPPPGAMQYPAPGQMPPYGYPPQPGPYGPPHVSFACSADARRQAIGVLDGCFKLPFEPQAGMLFWAIAVVKMDAIHGGEHAYDVAQRVACRSGAQCCLQSWMALSLARLTTHMHAGHVLPPLPDASRPCEAQYFRCACTRPQCRRCLVVKRRGALHLTCC